MEKYTRTERTEVLSPNQHKTVQDELQKMGKSSARTLSPDERQILQDALETEDQT